MKSFIAASKIFLILLWTAPLVTAQIFILMFHKGQGAYTVPRFWHKGISCILGLKTEIRGTPVHNQQLIYISNHLSYLDIPAIGSHLKASFIAKEDIAGWPVIGFLSRVQQTAFISRSSAKAKKVANALDTMVKEGKSLILFPEGTSSNGTGVLPFKSSLFSLAHPKDMGAISIQPFILELIDINGQAITLENRDLYAWYGDMDFGPHIWIFLKNRGATIRLTFLDVIIPTPDQDRKDLCKLVESQISSGLARA
jgi:1-acyl-sn-glycerol-3-phosphate acyltransferase